LTAPPFVSVLLPCRNAVAHLDEAMASLVDQTFQNLEIIAVDDGSSDGTAGLLDAWAARDPRVRTVSTPPLGIVSALNTAAAAARGELLARMDADDVAAPRRFEQQVALLDAHPDTAACGTCIQYIPRRLVRDGARRYERWINGVVSPDEMERDLFVECPVPHPTLVVRQAAFEQVGGYRDMGWPEDYDLILRLWEVGYRIGKVPEVLLDWRERPDRLSRTDSRYDEDAFRRCKARFIGRRIAGRNVVVWGAGPVGKTFARALQAEGHNVAAFIDLDPRKIGQTIHGGPVVPPASITEYGGAYVLAAVGSSGARADIRRELHAAGFREPEDCCAVA
jgi:glycosyltransferase involved in cell wall biosynthesis